LVKVFQVAFAIEDDHGDAMRILGRADDALQVLANDVGKKS